FSAGWLGRLREVAHLAVLFQPIRHSLRSLSLAGLHGRSRLVSLRCCAARCSANTTMAGCGGRSSAFQAATQRFHDVDDFAALLLFFLRRLDRFALSLGLDAIEQSAAVII